MNVYVLNQGQNYYCPCLEIQYIDLLFLALFSNKDEFEALVFELCF